MNTLNKEQMLTRILFHLQEIAFGYNDDVKIHHRLTAMKMLIKLVDSDSAPVLFPDAATSEPPERLTAEGCGVPDGFDDAYTVIERIRSSEFAEKETPEIAGPVWDGIQPNRAERRKLKKKG